MAEYAANCPISRPIHHDYLKPDADFNGVMFNYEQGFIFNAPEADLVTVRPPTAPFDESMEKQ